MKHYVALLIAGIVLVGCEKQPPVPREPEARALMAVADTSEWLVRSDTLRDTLGYVIVITSRGAVDTTWDVVSVDTIARPQPRVGVPFGTAIREKPASMGVMKHASVSAGSPKYMVQALQWAKRMGLTSVTMNLPGGGHNANQCQPLPSTDCGPNLSRIDGIPRYDSTKYLTNVRSFDLAWVRDTVKKYCRPTGNIYCEINAYDEPHVTGGWDGASMTDGNTWGDKGWMTKAKVDRGCQALKQTFHNLIPVGPAGAPTLFYPEQPAYRYCDFIRAQYSWRMSRVKNSTGVFVSPRGGREKWWADQVAAAKGLPLAPSINIINGGIQDYDGTWDCKAAREGGIKGNREPNCAIVPDSVRAYLLYFGTVGSGGHMMWRQDEVREVRLQNTYTIVADSLKKVPYKPIPVR